MTQKASNVPYLALYRTSLLTYGLYSGSRPPCFASGVVPSPDPPELSSCPWTSPHWKHDPQTQDPEIWLRPNSDIQQGCTKPSLGWWLTGRTVVAANVLFPDLSVGYRGMFGL